MHLCRPLSILRCKLRPIHHPFVPLHSLFIAPNVNPLPLSMPSTPKRILVVLLRLPAAFLHLFVFFLAVSYRHLRHPCCPCTPSDHYLTPLCRPLCPPPPFNTPSRTSTPLCRSLTLLRCPLLPIRRFEAPPPPLPFNVYSSAFNTFPLPFLPDLHRHLTPSHRSQMPLHRSLKPLYHPSTPPHCHLAPLAFYL